MFIKHNNAVSKNFKSLSDEDFYLTFMERFSKIKISFKICARVAGRYSIPTNRNLNLLKRNKYRRLRIKKL